MSSDNDKIKSALEIALEKAERLGSFSGEEKQRRKAEEMASAGESLARRYLNGATLHEVEAELAAREAHEQPAVRDRLLSCLLDEINLSAGSGNDRILAAIAPISGDAEPATTLKDLLRGHQHALEQARRENAGPLETAKIKELEQKGISGSAVEPAIETSDGWVQARQVLDLHFEQRLDEIKRRYGGRGEPTQGP